MLQSPQQVGACAAFLGVGERPCWAEVEEGRGYRAAWGGADAGRSAMGEVQGACVGVLGGGGKW